MPSNLSWMLNEKILLLECEGQIETTSINNTYAEIKHMVGQTIDKQAYLLVDMSNSESKDYEYTFLSQLDIPHIKGVIVVSDMLEPLKPLTQRIEKERLSKSIPQVLFGTDREIAFNYLAQIVDKSAMPA